MLIGIRKKHWLMFSLSVTCFLLVLVFTSNPIQLPRTPTGDGEIGFLRRHIAHDNGQETASASSASAGPSPPPPPPEPEPDPSQGFPRDSAPSQRRPESQPLTEDQRKDLASLGVLLVEDEDHQQQHQHDEKQEHKQKDEQQMQLQQQQEQVQARQLTEYNPQKQHQQQQQHHHHQQQQQQNQDQQKQEEPQHPPQSSPSPPPPPPPPQQQQQKQQQLQQPIQQEPKQPTQQPQQSQQKEAQPQQPQQTPQQTPQEPQSQPQQPQQPQPQQQPQQEPQLAQQQSQPQSPPQPTPQPPPQPPRGSHEKRPSRPRRPARPRVPLVPPHAAAAARGGSEHDQWLRHVVAQHQEFLKQQHRLTDHHHQGTHRLKQRLRQHQDSDLQTVSPKSGIRGTGSLARPAPPRVTYETIKRQGESALRSMLKREFINTQKDTNFIPGEVVDPSQVRRVLVLSTWRSGSSYLGDLLRTYPGTFYSFEPLHVLLKNAHLQDGPLVEDAHDLLRSILTCDYSHMDEYIAYLRNVTYLLHHNTRLWNSCALNRALCFDKEYVSRMCSYMPVNVLKTVRMGVLPVVKLLEDKALNLHVVHLVRDPRGCLHSRMQLSWCQSPACRDPATVCQDLLTDLTHSEQLMKKYSDRYMVVRYEDLALKPEKKAREIFKFLGLSYNKYVSTYVKEHTTLYKKPKRKNAYSTFRDSKATVFAWRGSLDYERVADIQDQCEEPLQRLGMRTFSSEDEYLNTTVPVLLHE